MDTGAWRSAQKPATKAPAIVARKIHVRLCRGRSRTRSRWSFTVELRGRNTVKVPEIDLLLKSVLGNALPADDTGSTTIASAVDGANFTLTSETGFNPGRAIAVETSTAGKYEVGWIAGNSSGVIVLNHALSFTPTAGKQVRGSVLLPPDEVIPPLIVGSEFGLFDGYSGRELTGIPSRASGL